jgi:AraC-like DNA-binding protein
MGTLLHALSMAAQGKAVLNGSDTASLYRELHPPAPHPLVRCWWEQRIEDGVDGYLQRVLPDACADLIVSADGNAIVVGPAMSAALPYLRGGERLRGLRIRTAAIGTALRLPAYELRDIQVPLRDLFPAAEAERITEGIRRAEHPFLLLDPGPRDLRVEHALGLLGRGASRVADVAGHVGMSERHLRRLLLAHTGLEPRMLQRVARFQRFLTLADRDRAQRSLADLAAHAGYADQAHLSRDVHALSALTPSALLAERHRAHHSSPAA